ARMYLDFEHIDRYKAVNKVLSHDTPLKDMLLSSSNVAAGQNRTLSEYNRVKSQFLVKKRASSAVGKAGAGTRDKWYEGNLRDLHTVVGKQEEYDAIVSPFHGCMHSGSFAVRSGPPLHAEYVMFFASTIAARVALLSVQCNQLDISSDDREVLEEYSK